MGSLSRRLMPGLVVLFGTILLSAASGADRPGKLMRFADVHGKRVVFTYEGDLWLASTEGGPARRLTRHEGSEVFAKFSPDGKRIAFTASYDGGVDVYVMDVSGGAPKRLTFHPAADYVQEWFPDGKWILFRSRGRTYPNREYSLWKVPAEGGMPVKLPIPRGGLATVSEDGTAVAYNPVSREFATWKQYRGGMAMDIWICRLAEGRFEKITDFPGNDNWPMWVGHRIYYASEQGPAANLYFHDLETGVTAQVTHYEDYDVKYPSRGGPGDHAIVYQHGGELHLLDTASGEIRKIPVTLPTDETPMRESWVPSAPYVECFGLSPTGVRMVFASRGDLFTVPAKEGPPRCLTPESSGSREKAPAWSPDGRYVAFLSDRTGEEELYLVDRKGGGEWIRLTTDGRGFRLPPVWSPDARHIAFADKYLRLNLVDVAAKTCRVVDRAPVDTGWEDWGVQEYSFSPDGKWLVYTKVMENQLESIFLYSLEQERVISVTGEDRNDFSPSFDPEGKYLYFLSDRTFQPVMGHLDQNHVFLDMTKPYVLILKEGEPSPFKPGLGDEEVKAEGGKVAAGKKEKGEKGTPGLPAVHIDTEAFDRRVVPAPVPAGSYFRLEAVKGGFLYLKKRDREFLKYQAVKDGTSRGYDLYKFDLASKKSDLLHGDVGNYHLSPDGKRRVVRTAGGFVITGAVAKGDAGAERVRLDGVRVRVDRRAEFRQMFDEAWRIERDFFYDPNMHGVDWEAVGRKYRALLPWCGNRSDLTYLIGEMIGELHAGHTYVYGGDTGFKSDAPRPRVGLLGVDFDVEAPGDYYRIAAILPGDNSDPALTSPLYAPDCPVEEGDYLIALDGTEVRKGMNVYALLTGKVGVPVLLTYNSEPGTEGAKTYTFVPVASENALRYRRWVEGRRALVEAATKGRVAYMHLPDMMQGGLIEFAKVYYAQHHKQGLVIDDRYNGGGFTGDMIIDRLERRLWSLTKPREGGILRNPENVFYGPMVLLVNAYTGSNGEYFASAFQFRKLGPVVGTRTWGGAVGIEPRENLVDGGTVTPPQYAPYSPWTGEWYFEGHGVDPDVVVENPPAEELAGKDPQLERAVELVLARMKGYYKEWKELPGPPPYPDKH